MSVFIGSKQKATKRKTQAVNDQEQWNNYTTEPPPKKKRDGTQHAESVIQGPPKHIIPKMMLKPTGFSNCSNFAAIRPIKKVHRSQFPNPEADGLNIFIYNAEYGWDKEYGTLLRWYGIMENTNSSVYLQLHGFDAHFMVHMGDAINENDSIVQEVISALEIGMLKYINKNILQRTKKYQNNPEVGNIGIYANSGELKLIKRWERKYVEPLMDRGMNGKLSVIDIYVEHPKLVRIARDLIENYMGCDPSEKNRWTEITRWCEGEEYEDELENFDIYEADVDFTVRWLVDDKKLSCHWYRLEAKKYQYIEIEDELRCTTCDMEILADYKDLAILPDSQTRRLPDLVVLVFDEEWGSTGKLFPNPKYDDMIKIVFKISTLNKSTKPISVLMSFKSVPNMEKNFDYVFCYENQVDYLADVLRFFRLIDADVWQHHNGNHFDIPYPLERAKFLGIKNADMLGRSKTKGVYLKQDKNKGFKKHFASIPGRINIDLLRITQDQFPGADGHGLDSLAKRFKVGTKGNLAYDMLNSCQLTEKGREKISKYCWKDVFLTDKIANDILKSIKVSIEVARLSGIPIDSALNRATTFKVEGGLRHECNTQLKKDELEKKEFNQVVKITNRKGRRFDMVFKVQDDLKDWEDGDGPEEVSNMDRKQAKAKGYKGATVIRPKSGYYADHVVVTLDFASMYPSIIMNRNLCFSTYISKETIEKNGYRWLVDYWSLPKIKIIDGQLAEVFDPNAPAFLMPHIKEGILPRLEKKWKTERGGIRSGPMKDLNKKIEACKAEIEAAIKASMTPEQLKKLDSSDDKKIEWGKLVEQYLDIHIEHIVLEFIQDYDQLDARQNAIKILMNSLYGMTGFYDSSFYCKEIAATVTGEGRNMLLKTKYIVETTFCRANGYPYDAIVIYGDTDSVFVQLKGLPADHVFGYIFGSMMARYVTELLRKPNIDVKIIEEDYKQVCMPLSEPQTPGYQILDPIKNAEASDVTTAISAPSPLLQRSIQKNPFIEEVELTFEKDYLRTNLILAKNYEGLKFVMAKDKPEFEAKGLQFLKRGLCSFAKETLKKVSEIVCVDGKVEDALEYARDRLKQLRQRRVDTVDLIQKMRLSKDLNQYGKIKTVFSKKENKIVTRKTAEGIAVTLARKNWEIQKKWAEEAGIDPNSPAVRPAGAGDSVEYVFVDTLWQNKKKAKKRDMVMDPLEAIKTKANIDYDEYISSLEKNLCKILRHPVNYLYPGGVTLAEDANNKIDIMFKEQLKRESQARDEEDSDSEEEEEDDDEAEEELDIIDDLNLTAEQIIALDKREKELEKLLDAKVIRVLYEGKGRPPTTNPTEKKIGVMHRYIIPAKKCANCQNIILDDNTRSQENKAICIDCHKSKPDFYSDLKKISTDTERKLEVVWQTCERCFDAPREETVDCQSFSCQYMRQRINLGNEAKNLTQRLKDIDISW